MDPKQKGFVYQQVKQAIVDENPEALLDETLDISESAMQASGGSGGEPTVRPIDILQVHQSYVVTQDEHGIVIVDQHALHERVMFEQLTQRITKGNLESQRLLMPATIDASQSRLDQLTALQPLLTRLGIEAEQLGPQTIAIHAFPSFLFEKKVEPDPFIEELLDAAEDGRFDITNPKAQEAAQPQKTVMTYIIRTSIPIFRRMPSVWSRMLILVKRNTAKKPAIVSIIIKLNPVIAKSNVIGLSMLLSNNKP